MMIFLRAERGGGGGGGEISSFEGKISPNSQGRGYINALLHQKRNKK